MMTQRSPSMTTTDIESGSMAGDESFVNGTAKVVATNGTKAEAEDDGGSKGSSNESNSSGALRKLSTVSRFYDIDGDGELDKAEQQMRNMDQSGRGHLTNEQVYEIVQNQIDIQKQLFRTRKVTMVLLALVVILAISNLGTSFAAASLAKDTSTNENEELTAKSSAEVLSTQTTEETFEIQRTITDSETGERRLCKNGENCEVDSYISMDKRACGRMVRQCARGRTVTVSRPWQDGSTSVFNICPYEDSTVNDYDQSRYTNRSGQHFYFERVEGGHCKIHGNAVTQDEGMICEMDWDCDTGSQGMGCLKVEAKVEACQRRCGLKRWAEHRVKACQDSCDHPTCQRLEDDERE